MMATTASAPTNDSVTDASVSAPTGSAKRQLHGWEWVKWRVLKPLASLQLTVVLFALSTALVFFGTLAQVDTGIWTVVNDYFRSAVVLVPLQIFFPRTISVPGAFPFPGGWLLGGLLLVNLFAAHTVRFKLSWKRAGIIMTHLGLIVLMLGELVTGLFAIEGTMTIEQGQSSNFVQHDRYAELVVIDNFTDPKVEDVVAIPQSRLRPNTTISDPQLPFTVEVIQYMSNSVLLDVNKSKAKAGSRNLADRGKGLQAVAVPKAEVPGASQEQMVDVPSCYVRLREPGTDRVLGTWLMSVWLDNQPVEVGGKTYQVALRWKRTYRPFEMHLIEFRFDRYEGTEIPKNYSSRIRLVDPERNVDREVLIRMNEPLRYRGETFFQSSFDKRTEKTTILQVVRNPGWTLPYISCAMVTLGLMVHFCMSLATFLRRTKP
jgi:hypothetical protein